MNKVSRSVLPGRVSVIVGLIVLAGWTSAVGQDDPTLAELVTLVEDSSDEPVVQANLNNVKDYINGAKAMATQQELEAAAQAAEDALVIAWNSGGAQIGWAEGHVKKLVCCLEAHSRTPALTLAFNVGGANEHSSQDEIDGLRNWLNGENWAARDGLVAEVGYELWIAAFRYYADDVRYQAWDGVGDVNAPYIDGTTTPVYTSVFLWDAPLIGSVTATRTTVAAGVPITVSVVATDPNGDTMQYAWEQASGPGAAAIAAPDASSTTVTFDEEGEYVLRILVSDGNDYIGLGTLDVMFRSLDFELLSIEVITIQVTPTSGLITSESGATATFTIVLGSPPTDDAVIGLSSSDTTEGTVLPSSVTFTSANWDTPQTVTASGVDDVIDDGDIVFTITAAVYDADDDPDDDDATNYEEYLDGTDPLDADFPSIGGGTAGCTPGSDTSAALPLLCAAALALLAGRLRTSAAAGLREQRGLRRSVVGVSAALPAFALVLGLVLGGCASTDSATTFAPESIASVSAYDMGESSYRSGGDDNDEYRPG